MKTEQPLLITTITAASNLDIFKNHFIDFTGDVCINGAKALGVLNANTNDGEQAPVVVSGIALVKTGAAITVGAKVESDSTGRAIPLGLGSSNGYALDAASGADELIRVLLV